MVYCYEYFVNVNSDYLLFISLGYATSCDLHHHAINLRRWRNEMRRPTLNCEVVIKDIRQEGGCHCDKQSWQDFP